MLKICLAGIKIAIYNKYPFVERMCADYIASCDGEVDFSVRVDEDKIAAEIAASSHKTSRGYAESICIYRQICANLPSYGAFLLHAAVVELNGEAYAFSARSGTGKSTHVMLWKRLFGDRVGIINGDKPIVRIDESGDARIYGTPWCGKEGLNINTSAPLKALCFIERGEQNSICGLQGDALLIRLVEQVYMPETEQEIKKLTALLDRLLEKTPCYLLSCNMDISAAEVAYEGMKNG